MRHPDISVVMSVYNGSNHLKPAIESILNQSFSDFEFLIINDASTDNSLGIIKSYDDKRIVIINNEGNLGLTKSLNKGITLAKGDYIARMDCDDICVSTRLQKQYDYLEDNKDIAVCGTNYNIISGSNSNFPLDNETLKVKLFQGKNLVAHPSTMFRRELFDRFNIRYDETVKYAQDFKLWVDIAQKFKIVNLAEPLLKYRIHSQQISNTKSKEQKKVVEKICLVQLNNLLGDKICKNDLSLHLQFIHETEVNNLTTLNKIENWVHQLIAKNNEKLIYETIVFRRELLLSLKRIKTNYFTQNFLKSQKFSIKLLPIYFSNKFKAYKCYNFRINFYFFIKCLISYNSN